MASTAERTETVMNGRELLPPVPPKPVHPKHERPLGKWMPLKLLDGAEDLLHAAIGLVLLTTAGFVLFEALRNLFQIHPLFPAGVIAAINNVLFVIIILEILRTVTAHFTDGGFQVGPFLIIGIISAVRHILTVSASLTLEGDGSETHFLHAITELGVNGGLVLALVIGLTLLRRSDANERSATPDKD